MPKINPADGAKDMIKVPDRCTWAEEECYSKIDVKTKGKRYCSKHAKVAAADQQRGQSSSRKRPREGDEVESNNVPIVSPASALTMAIEQAQHCASAQFQSTDPRWMPKVIEEALCRSLAVRREHYVAGHRDALPIQLDDLGGLEFQQIKIDPLTRVPALHIAVSGGKRVVDDARAWPRALIEAVFGEESTFSALDEPHSHDGAVFPALMRGRLDRHAPGSAPGLLLPIKPASGALMATKEGDDDNPLALYSSSGPATRTVPAFSLHELAGPAWKQLRGRMIDPSDAVDDGARERLALADRILRDKHGGLLCMARLHDAAYSEAHPRDRAALNAARTRAEAAVRNCLVLLDEIRILPALGPHYLGYLEATIAAVLRLRDAAHASHWRLAQETGALEGMSPTGMTADAKHAAADADALQRLLADAVSPRCRYCDNHVLEIDRVEGTLRASCAFCGHESCALCLKVTPRSEAEFEDLASGSTPIYCTGPAHFGERSEAFIGPGAPARPGERVGGGQRDEPVEFQPDFLAACAVKTVSGWRK